jgi:hypothetical protein
LEVHYTPKNALIKSFVGNNLRNKKKCDKIRKYKNQNLIQTKKYSKQKIMNTHSHYRVRSLPTKSQNFFLSLLKRKKTKIIASIVGFYFVLGGGLGFMLFKPNSEVAQASNIPVAVAANFSINNIDAIVQDGLIDGSISLTNQSLTEDLTNVNLDLYSTKESVKWSQLNYEGSPENIIPSKDSTFSLLPIKKNSSVNINIKGLLINKSLPNVGLMAKIIFDSRQGQLETTSNRILLKLGEGGSVQGQLPNLKTDKIEYLAKEKVFFNLENFDSRKKNNIKLSISNKVTGELVANTLECQSDIEGQCLISYDKLDAGKYGAVFLDKDKNPASQIINFEVKNSSGEISGTDFKANPNATLELPFGSGSLGGQVAVLAQNVVMANSSVSEKDKCTFQLMQNGSILQQFQTNILNKKCFSNLEINGEAGIYQIKLLGSSIEKSFSFLPKSKNSVKIQKISGGEKKQPIKFNLSGLQINTKKTTFSSSSQTTESQNITLNTAKLTAKVGIHRVESGLVQEITTLNNNQIIFSNSEESVEIPGSYFELEGNYNIYMILDNGQQSDFLNFEISDKTIGFSTGNIILKPGTVLKVGQKNTFEINGLNFRSGKPIQSGTCENIIIEESGNKIGVTGEINNGRCEFSTDNIKKTGLITIVNSRFNLASQFVLKSEKINNYGDINIAFSPVFPNKTNKIIAGPFTDEFDNPANQKTMKIVVGNSNKEKMEIPLEIIEGFGEAIIPSSLINGEEISFRLLDGDKEITSKQYEISVENELIMPVIPNKITDEERVRGLFYTNIINSEEKCKLKVITIGQKNIQQEFNPILENKSCILDWGSTDGKLAKKNLIEFKVGNSNYNYLISSHSKKPSQIFDIFSNIIDNGNGALNLDLMTSSIKDSNDLPITKGELEWSFNGKNKKTSIVNGVANMSIKLSDLESKNIKKEGESNFLNLEVDAKASEISLSKSIRLNLNLGRNTLSEKSYNFTPLYAQNNVNANSTNIWRFRTNSCDVSYSTTEGVVNVNSYLEKEMCLIIFNSGNAGTSRLNFLSGGSIQNTFEFANTDSIKENNFCEKINEKCVINITPEVNNLNVSALTKEGEFSIGSSSNDASIFSLVKEDADPNQNYTVMISYDDSIGEKYAFYRELSGKVLTVK